MIFDVKTNVKMAAKRTISIICLGLSLMVIVTSQANAESLVIWSSDQMYLRALQASGKQFAADTGVDVEVKAIADFNDIQAALASKRQLPDIIIWPHNRFGTWAEQQVLKPVKPSKQIVKELTDEWRSVSYAGDIYGYPILLQGPTLIYNQQLVKKAPKSWQDLQKLSESLSLQGKTAISWDYSNIYFSYPLISAEGGFLFENTQQGWDIESVGINSDGAAAGMSVLKMLVADKVVPQKTGYRQADQMFARGQSAMTINGPWSWNNYKLSGIDLGVIPFPKVKSNYGKGLYTVMSAGITSTSELDDLAQSFIEHYILSEKTLSALSSKYSPALYTHKKFMKSYMKNLSVTDPDSAANLEVAVEIWAEGEPLPNVSSLPALNNHMAIAINALVDGRMEISEALDEVANNF